MRKILKEARMAAGRTLCKNVIGSIGGRRVKIMKRFVQQNRGLETEEPIRNDRLLFEKLQT